MKILHTYWSAPTFLNEQNDSFGRNTGGWGSEKLHAISWALSCLKFKSFYKVVELYTDNNGVDWLINKLNLPYTNVIKSLNDFSYPVALWALSKIKTYQLQVDPFLHVDGDVYIWKRFDSNFIRKPLVAQNIEYETSKDTIRMYEPTALKIVKESKNYPVFVDSGLINFQKKGRFEAYNMGIFGGEDILFIKQYCEYVFDFIKKNSKITFVGRDMNFIEQFFLYGLAQEKKREVTTLLTPENGVSEMGYSNIAPFHIIPYSKFYAHLLANSKKKLSRRSQLEARLRYEFPKVYNHISRLYIERKIYHIYKGAQRETNHIEDAFINTLTLLKKIKVINTPSYKELKSFVYSYYENNNENSTYQLIYDVFNIEECFWFKRNKTRKNEMPCNKSTLDLLYGASKKEILKQQFTLNKEKAKIVLQHYNFPKRLSLNILNNLLEKGSLKNEQLKMGILLGDEENGEISFIELTGINVALFYFEDKAINGMDLVRLLKKNVGNMNRSTKELRERVIEFILSNVVYFNFLKIVATH